MKFLDDIMEVTFKGCYTQTVTCNWLWCMDVLGTTVLLKQIIHKHFQ